MRYDRPSEATITIWEDGARLCVAWTSTDHWRDILQSLKATFWRHGDLSYSAARKLWSLPLHNRHQLESWLSRTFAPACVA